MSYEELSMEELETLRLEKMQVVESARADLAAVSRAYEKKARAANLQRKLGDLSAEDLELLQELIPAAQSMSAKGIESSEQIGIPGQ